jgi:hypothetical protein
MALRGREAAASVPSPLQFTSGVSQEQQRPVKNRKDQQNHRHHYLSAAGSADRARITPMAEHKHPGSNSPQQNADQRRTGNPPTKTKKSDAPAANTPKSPADLAIPPDN